MATNEKIFEAGKYYLVDQENTVVFSSKNIIECRDNAMAGDLILIALDPDSIGKHKESAKTISFPKETPKPDKIVVDFTKNILTITGCSVKLLNEELTEGTIEFDSSKWVELVQDCNKKAKCVEFIGEPTVKNGKDITNEMSDM
jgi:hypothetical protein